MSGFLSRALSSSGVREVTTCIGAAMVLLVVLLRRRRWEVEVEVVTCKGCSDNEVKKR